MTKRERPSLEGNYFTSEKTSIQFISTGCTLLDCALGGGWALGRIANIVGDRSTAKTALATEALINFYRKYPNGFPAYCETEAAFDQGYAEAMGLDLAKIDFRGLDDPINTVEQFAKDVENFIQAREKDKCPGIYVLDSLDALSDDAEMKRSIGEATFGVQKAKLLSEFFRKTARRIENTKVLLLVVSQVRDNIGAMMGEKHKRSGGRALDFYCSQVGWLTKIKTLKRTVKKVERAYGVTIKASIKKNKVGLPFREVEMDFIFGYGVDDLSASIDWLEKVGRLEDPKKHDEIIKKLDSMSEEEINDYKATINEMVRGVWADIENSFLPARRKYG